MGQDVICLECNAIGNTKPPPAAAPAVAAAAGAAVLPSGEEDDDESVDGGPTQPQVTPATIVEMQVVPTSNALQPSQLKNYHYTPIPKVPCQ